MTDNPNPIGNFDPAMLATLSPQTKAAFASQMVSVGHDRAAVEAALDPQKPTPAKEFPAALTAQEATAAATDRIFAAPATPEGYRITLPSFMLEDDPTDAAAFFTDLKAGFHEAGVPAQLADPMFQSIADAVEKFPDGEAERQAYLLNQTNLAKSLERTNPDLKKFADIGQKALGKAGEELYQVGAFSTVNALVALSQFGRIVEQRSKRSAK
jgi:hypothetical protein